MSVLWSTEDLRFCILFPQNKATCENYLALTFAVTLVKSNSSSSSVYLKQTPFI